MPNLKFNRMILKLAIFLFTTFFIFIAIFFSVYTCKIQPDTTFFYKDFSDYLNNTGDADILVIGNSKALSSLSSSILNSQLDKKTYNMAYRAANLIFTKDLLNSYLKNSLRKPSICVLEVSWCSFSNSLTSYPNDKPQLVIKLKNFKEIIKAMRDNRSSIIEEAIENIRSDRNSKYTDWWDGDPKKSAWIFNPNKFKVEDMSKVYSKLEAGIDEELFQSYLDIINTCKKNKIKLILYSAPVAPIYASFHKDKALVNAAILKSVQDNQLEYFDFTVGGQYYAKEMDNLLYDSQHVRRSDVFTKLFLLALKSKNSI
jgi:hypothetical protein